MLNIYSQEVVSILLLLYNFAILIMHWVEDKILICKKTMNKIKMHMQNMH